MYWQYKIILYHHSFTYYHNKIVEFYNNYIKSHKSYYLYVQYKKKLTVDNHWTLLKTLNVINVENFTFKLYNLKCVIEPYV